MATYEIKGPDGGLYRISAPDSATEKQVMDHFMANYQSAAAPQEAQGPSMADIKSAAAAKGVAPEDIPVSPTPYPQGGSPAQPMWDFLGELGASAKQVQDSIINGMTLGLGRHASALGRSLAPGGGTYREQLGRGDQARQAWSENAPGAAPILEAIGAFAGPGAAAKLGKGAPGLLKMMGLGAAEGSVYGGANTAGADTSASDVLSGAKTGAAVGGLLPLLLKGGQVGAEKLGRGLYGAALRFPKEIGFQGRRNAVTAGLENALPAKEAGVTKLQETLAPLNKKYDSLLGAIERAGKKEPVGEFWDRVAVTEMDNPTLQAEPGLLEKAVERLALRHTGTRDMAKLPEYTAKELDILKRSMSDRLKFSAEPGGFPTTSERKTAFGKAYKEAKNTLEGMSPRIADLNAQRSPLLSLRDPLYSTAFEGRVMSEHPLMASAAAHQVAPAGSGAIGHLLGMVGLNPGNLSSAGIKSYQASKSPLLRALGRRASTAAAGASTRR